MRTFSVRHSTARPRIATGMSSEGVPTHHDDEVPSHSKAPKDPRIETKAAPNAAGLRMCLPRHAIRYFDRLATTPAIARPSRAVGSMPGRSTNSRISAVTRDDSMRHGRRRIALRGRVDEGDHRSEDDERGDDLERSGRHDHPQRRQHQRDGRQRDEGEQHHSVHRDAAEKREDALPCGGDGGDHGLTLPSPGLRNVR